MKRTPEDHINLLSPHEEACLVEGVRAKIWHYEKRFYEYCHNYFKKTYTGVFFADKPTADEIFQNSFISLWEKIERGECRVENGVLIGKDDEPFTASLLTFFMSIAANKYKEYVRTIPILLDPAIEQTLQGELNPKEYANMVYDKGENMKLEIIADIMSKMPQQCFEIISKFYYEEKSLDAILGEIGSFESYEALKERKYKCMKTLRIKAQEIYQTILNKL